MQKLYVISLKNKVQSPLFNSLNEKSNNLINKSEKKYFFSFSLVVLKETTRNTLSYTPDIDISCTECIQESHFYDKNALSKYTKNIYQKLDVECVYIYVYILNLVVIIIQ